MKKISFGFIAICIFCFNANAQNTPKKDNGVITPEKLESWVPVPVITPGTTNADAPSDAIVLFNGKDLSAFQKKDGSPAKWRLDPEGTVTDVKGAGDLITKKAFGNCQLHVEFRTPAEVKNSGQSRGNSGVYFMGKYEVQVLDSYDNVTYSNGQDVEAPGRVTVIHNGVLVQNNVSILGPTDWAKIPVYKKHESKLPLMFQDHGDDGNPISYRNIWIREL